MLAKHSRLVPFYIKKYFGKQDPSQYEDILQEGYIGLITAIHNYDEKLGTFSNYAGECIRIAILSYYKKLRKQKRTMILPIQDLERPSFEEQIPYIVSWFGVDKADKKMIEMKFLQGMKLRQIAEILGISKQAASTHIIRGLAKIKHNYTRIHNK